VSGINWIFPFWRRRLPPVALSSSPQELPAGRIASTRGFIGLATGAVHVIPTASARRHMAVTVRIAAQRMNRPTARTSAFVQACRFSPVRSILGVLEAVHLLLALELFVVVVGVDPRWLQRSLRHQYQDLVTSGDPRTDPYLRAMPIEYPEKIFQIPLTLPSMEPGAYAQLIASLGPPSITTPGPTEAKATAPAHRAPTNESPGGDRTPTRAPL
jgi:hypothetical protein